MKAPKIKIFSDGASINDMMKMAQNPLVKGFTTNPSLMRKSGVTNYRDWAKAVLTAIKLPVSFEVFADDIETMINQGRRIAKWGSNINVKIPITNTKGESTRRVLKHLTNDGIQVNVTAIFTLAQVQSILDILNPDVPAIVSVFAGRIADTGVDPMPHMAAIKRFLNGTKVELLWASTREIFNIFQAESCGCDIITVQPEFLAKLDTLLGKDLLEYSKETVCMFYKDAKEAAYEV